VQSRAAAVPVLLAVLLSGCSAGVDEPDTAGAVASASADVATPAPSPSAAAPTAAAVTPAPSPTPQVRTIDVAYAGGQVTGTTGREEVRLGEQVVVRVTSDVAEEVHVHGYDLLAEVTAGGTAEIPVSATIPGVFEVEMEESGKALFQLRVA